MLFVIVFFFKKDKFMYILCFIVKFFVIVGEYGNNNCFYFCKDNGFVFD